MAALQRFAAILVADLRERTRTTRFWVVLVAMMVTAWWCIPPASASYMILSLGGGYRGAYSSAWIGMLLAMAFNLLLNLGGFYLVRGTLARDIDTRVWQLLVATPMTRAGFLLAKWASHMLVFALIVAACLTVGLVAQWVRAEDRSIDLVELVKPALLISLPGLAMTALAAIWFDLIPWLRRTAGNVLFFLLFTAMLGLSVSRLEVADSAARTGWTSDPSGLQMVGRDFQRVRSGQTGAEEDFGFGLGAPRPATGPILFEWKQWPVRPMDVLGRGLWVVIALGGLLLAAPLLDRSAARASVSAHNRGRPGMRLRWLDLLLRPFARGSFATLAVAELQMCLRQRRPWWWLAALVALGLQLSGSGEALRIGMLLGWLLPLDVIARGALREREHRTGALVFTAAGIVRRLAGVRFMVGFVLLLALTLPGLLHLAMAAPMAALVGVVVVASIVIWGMALGAISRDARPFELLLVGAVYLAYQGAPLFDLGEGAATTATWHGLGIVVALLALAAAWPRLARA